MKRTRFDTARKAVTMDSKIAKIRKMFENPPDIRAGNVVHRLCDVFMSSLAKKHKDGSTIYHYNMLCAALASRQTSVF